jgi:hypothetical protein
LVMTTTLPDLLLVPGAMAADSDPEGTCTLYRRKHHYCQDMARFVRPSHVKFAILQKIPLFFWLVIHNYRIKSHFG